MTGLDAARDVPPDQSVLAHSYGSVVLSFALRRPTGIDRVALFGSPGTGGAVRSIVDTGLKPGGFNVLGSIDDPVVASGRVVLGPAAAAVVGARALSTYAPGGAGSPGAGRTSRGHSDYLKAGSDSAFNLAAVVADRRDATVAGVRGRAQAQAGAVTPHRGAEPVVHPQMLWRHAGMLRPLRCLRRSATRRTRIVGVCLRSRSQRAYSYPYI